MDGGGTHFVHEWSLIDFDPVADRARGTKSSIRIISSQCRHGTFDKYYRLFCTRRETHLTPLPHVEDELRDSFRPRYLALTRPAICKTVVFLSYNSSCFEALHK